MMYLLFSFIAATVSVQGIVTPVIPVTCAAKRTPALDVFFLVDGSTSIGASEWPGQLFFIKKLVENTIEDYDRVGVYQFSSPEPYSVNNVGQVEYSLGTSRNQIVNTVQQMKQRKGYTPTKEAIYKVIDLFKSAPADGQNRDRLLVIITDGEPTCQTVGGEFWCSNTCKTQQGVVMTEVSDRLEAENIQTVIIGVDNDASRLECLVEDPAVNIVKISSFNSFDEYRDPTGNDKLLCVDPKEFELECCRAKVSQNQKFCNKLVKYNCVNHVVNGSKGCQWGFDTNAKAIDGCGVTASPVAAPTSKPTTGKPTPEPTTAKPTPEPTTSKPTPEPTTAEPTAEPTTSMPTPAPTHAPTRLVCKPLNNCVVKHGIKVFGWVNAGGRMKASSACACAERCEMEGGSESKWHVSRKVCKCWKQSSHIQLKSEPFEPNAKHGGNAGGKTQCVQFLNSVAKLTYEKVITTAPTSAPTAVETSKPTYSAEAWKKLCDERRNNMPFVGCTWSEANCFWRCA